MELDETPTGDELLGFGLANSFSASLGRMELLSQDDKPSVDSVGRHEEAIAGRFG